MNMKEMIAFVRALKGHMPENVRCAVAHGVCDLIDKSIESESLPWWQTKGQVWFLADCGLDDFDKATTRNDLTAEPSALAKVVNKWRSVKAYKDDDGEYRDLTVEMKSLIMAITEELEEISVQ